MNLMKNTALILTVIFLAGCQVNSEETAETYYQPVTAVKAVSQQEFLVPRTFSGVLLPANRVVVAFEFAGKLQTMLVNEGDRVDEGELLARLDTSLLDIERRELQASLAEAQANLRLAEANLQRQQSLESDGFASQQRRDELEAGRDAVKANISRLQAMLDGNLLKQQKSHLNAPFAGVVGERYVEQGSTVAGGAPVLRLLQSGRMEAHVGLPRQLAQRVRSGDVVQVIVGGQEMSGTVLAVGAELKAGSHTVKLRIALPAQNTLSGSLAQLKLADIIASPGFELPQSALTASLRGLWRVYVLQPVADGLHRIEARDLQLRYGGEYRVYVEGGLADGELVVASGVHKLVPGQLVRIVADGDSA